MFSESCRFDSIRVESPHRGFQCCCRNDQALWIARIDDDGRIDTVAIAELAQALRGFIEIDED